MRHLKTILSMKLAGKTLQEIGDKLGISKQRVDQILQKHKESQLTSRVDIAKHFFLLGLQAEEVANKQGISVELSKAWEDIKDDEMVEEIIKNKDLFLLSIFSNK